MINTFRSQLNEINSGASRPKNVDQTLVKKLGVLGSGLMGHGITYVSALSGIEVVMIDSSQENAEKGLSRIKDILHDSVKLGQTTQENEEKILNRITATDDYNNLQDCDLIIEAVFEDRDLKGQVIQVDLPTFIQRRLTANFSIASSTFLSFRPSPRTNACNPPSRMCSQTLRWGARRCDRNR